jgi:hypothetical protein
MFRKVKKARIFPLPKGVRGIFMSSIYDYKLISALLILIVFWPDMVLKYPKVFLHSDLTVYNIG